MTSPCRAIARLVEGYLDGELGPSQLLEVENHTQSCQTCRERVVLDRAIRSGVRRTVTQARPTTNFRARAAASVIAQRWAPDRGTRSALPKLGGWLVAAAAAGMAVAGVHGRSQRSADSEARPVETAKASVGLDQMIDQFVDWHARPLPPEITNASDMPRFEPYVGVPVHPPSLSTFGARLIGGRILPMQEQRATAMLQYTLADGHRISVYVYDARRITASASRLHTKVMGSKPVYVGDVRGWSVAAAERPGVGYAIASDLGDDESAELALAAIQSQTP